ncbi:uncharacterized protein LOC132904355 [Amyelois transitella]|uniref:uncharacterized protein LOC132904355 n=1 Tax=Amyelois transitella TaxID=680683 RepID=UPI0029907C46|nr:uncharacterized protein LOC132904355 [Amyelois transitella]
MELSRRCAGCLKNIDSRQFLTCSICKQDYDLTCANVSEQRFFNTLTAEHRTAWKCPLCVCRQPRADNSNTPVRGATEGVTLRRGAAALSPSDHAGDVSISLPVSELNTTALNETMEITDVQALLYELRQFRDEYREDRAADRRLSEILTESLTKVNLRLDESDKRYEQLQARVDSLEQQMKLQTEARPFVATDVEQSLKESIANLKAELNERDQDLLLNDVEITCIVEQPGESLQHIAITLADKLGVKLKSEDLVSVSRVGPLVARSGAAAAVPAGGQGPRPVVVRLARRALRDELIRAARVRRGATTEGTGLPGPARRFFINERLTKVNRHLFRRARELATQYKWRFAWTREGRIYVRQHQAPDSPRIRIRNDQDLNGVFGLGVVCSTGQ